MTTTCVLTSLTPPPEAMVGAGAGAEAGQGLARTTLGKPRQPSSPRQFFARIYGDLEDVKTPPTTPSPSLAGPAVTSPACRRVDPQDLRKPVAIRSYRNLGEQALRPGDPLRAEDCGRPAAAPGLPLIAAPFEPPPASPLRLLPAPAALHASPAFSAVSAQDSTFPASFSAFRKYLYYVLLRCRQSPNARP